MNNYLVFREEGRTLAQSDETYAHNERTKDKYYNTNIDLTLSASNYYFVKPTEPYKATVRHRLDSGELTDVGLKKDKAHYLSEIIIGVNREYWYGKTSDEILEFFKAAYEPIAKRFGEENVLSAVIHTDEVSEGTIDGKNVMLTNYHMHIVAIPTVESKKYYTKRSQEYKNLAAKVGAENIVKNDPRLIKSTQRLISHSRFFESGRDEQHRIRYSYSVWQDFILEAIKQAGYVDIHRGVTDQKAVHIHPMAYKQIMEKIKEEADGCLPDFTPQKVNDDCYLIDKSELIELGMAKDKIEKEIAAFDLATDALVEEQKRVYERQNEVYVKTLQQKQFDYDMERLVLMEKAVERLEEENKLLKAAINYFKEMTTKIMAYFGAIKDKWDQLKKTSDQESAARLVNEIDESIYDGLNSLTQNKELGGR